MRRRQPSATAALARSTGRDVQYAAAFTAGSNRGFISVSRTRGRPREALSEHSSAEIRLTCRLFVPSLALNAHQPRQTASNRLRAARRYDFAVTGIGFNGHFGALHSVYVRGAAYWRHINPRKPQRIPENS